MAKLPAEGVSIAGDTLRIKMLCEIAFCYALHKPDSSIRLSEKALRIAEKIGHKPSIARANHQLGYSFLMTGKDFKGAEYLFKSLQLSEKLKIDTLIAVNNRQIGNTYFGLKNYDSAQEYYLKAMPYFLKIGYKKGYANCLNDIGRGYFSRKKLDEALKYFQKCLSYSEENSLSTMKSYCIWSIANTYIEKKEYNQALHYANLGMELNKTIEGIIEYDWIEEYNAFARIYYGLGNYKQALYYAEKPLKEFPDVGNVNKLPIYERLYEVYKKTGNSEKALYYYENYIKLIEENKKQEFEEQLLSMKFEYENLRLKDSNEILNQNLERESLIKKGLLIGLLGIMGFGIFFWWNNRLLKAKNLLIENQKNEILIVKSELEKLNATLENKVEERTLALTQANNELTQKNKEITEALVKGQTLERKRVASELHDNLGSTLSGIKWMLQALDVENLTEKEQRIYNNILGLMNNAYDEVRLISHHLLPNDFEEKGLFGALTKLVSDINQSDKLKIDLKIAEGITIDDKKIELELYSICLELINNILKHSQATMAEISFQQDSENLYLVVADNGRGINPESGIRGKGIENMKRRVETLLAQIDFNSITNKGTSIHVTVPFHTNTKG
ncbi:tetratricopeptide repeat-containing sensor histidine kinase [Emticicia sp. 17c]|uniref:tetratricopeptide repeat-containing sensor histidine kinase n=1 Tax=Emticicia sp. 17c TaxID=3127704 RepID=UPI00301CC2E2